MNTGIGFPALLFLVFLVLKLTGYISWSWWWVTSPLWIAFVLGALIAILVGVFGSRKPRRY